jgi:hypothetical protein
MRGIRVDGLNLRRMMQTCVPVKGQILKKRTEDGAARNGEDSENEHSAQGSNGPITCKILGMGSYEVMVDGNRL